MSLAEKVLIGGGALLLAGALGGVTVGPHLDRDVYTATVTDKERVQSGKSSYYRVYTRLPDGAVRVFQNTDSWLELKFNSADVQGELERGKTYRIHTYGWRVPFLSMFENITNVEKAEPVLPK